MDHVVLHLSYRCGSGLSQHCIRTSGGWWVGLDVAVEEAFAAFHFAF